MGENDVYMNIGSQKIGLKLKKVNRDIKNHLTILL